MRRRARQWVIGLLAAAIGAAVRPQVSADVTSWRAAATASDREKLRGWRDAWLAALATARGEGHGPAIVAEGAMFEPDGAVEGAMPRPGAYRCRRWSLGRQPGQTRPALTTYPPVACRVANGKLRVLAGPQRVTGRLFADTDARAVFLGTTMLGGEARAMAHGRDRERDVAGLVERVGERRWRLVVPYPNLAATLDVTELVPG